MSAAKPEVIELTIPFRPEYVAVARLTISGIGNRMGFSLDDIEDIKLAVAEACNNVIQHAYEGSNLPEEEIKIQCTVYPSKLDIIIKDKGKGFSPEALEPYMKRAVTKKEDERLGLGVFLMRNLMDEVEFQPNQPRGTQVHLVKYLKR